MGLRSWIITHRRRWDVLEHTNLVKGTGFLASFTVCDDSITSASALCFFPSAHRHLQIFPCSLLQSFCLSSSCPLMGRYWPITSIYKTTNLMIILVFFFYRIYFINTSPFIIYMEVFCILKHATLLELCLFLLWPSSFGMCLGSPWGLVIEKLSEDMFDCI